MTQAHASATPETPAPEPQPEALAAAQEAASELMPPPEAPQPSEAQRYEEEIAKLKDQLLRTAAEAENARRRFQRDQEETAKYAVTGFARDLVNVAENLKRAIESLTPEARAGNELLKTLGEGVDMTLRELLGVFEKQGIRRIDPMGEKFDHNLHQAVVQIENSAVPPGMVVQVLQAGYVIHDRLLRPAMVGVSKQGEPVKQVDTQA